MRKQVTGSLKFFRTGDNVLIRLSDIVDAVNIYNNFKTNHPEWSVGFITPAVFTEVCLATNTLFLEFGCLPSPESDSK